MKRRDARKLYHTNYSVYFKSLLCNIKINFIMASGYENNTYNLILQNRIIYINAFGEHNM
jgi:hypothetical protein